VSSDQVIMPRAKSVMGEDGRMTTLPMEDLWPFLERAEFSENMGISAPQESRFN